MRELARYYGAEALAVLVRQMRGDDQRLAQAAAAMVLDRAYGKPERLEAEALISSTVTHRVEFTADWRDDEGLPADRRGPSGNGAMLPARVPVVTPAPQRPEERTRLEPVQAQRTDIPGFTVR